MFLTKRQKQLLDFIEQFIRTKGYSPSLEEIGEGVNLSSLATVHKHLQNLAQKGVIKRSWNRSRSIEILFPDTSPRASREIPLLGDVAAGEPIEAVEISESVEVPRDFLGREETFVLRVRGDSMIEEGIHDRDFIVVARRPEAQNGETVVALVRGREATVKRFFRRNGKVHLEPANEKMPTLIFDPQEVKIQGVVIGLLRKYR